MKEDDIVEKIEKVIPLKNYIYLSIVVLVSILLLFYFYLWYLTYEEGKLNNQIMDRYLQVINYNELEDYISENRDAYVYVSVLENQEIRDFEIDFKDVIVDNSLKREILYLDLSDVYNNKSKLEKAKIKYNINNKNISNVPCILNFKNGKLNNIYDIKQNKYDVDKLEIFLTNEGLIDND